MFIIAFFLFISFIVFPVDAYAWGAGVHLEVGLHVLDNLHLLPAVIHMVLEAHPQDFLYGCISADITIGKKFAINYMNHCHAWRMGKKILKSAEADHQKACAYGYLTHLAADTIAHSYFVPFKMIRSFNTVLLKHTYWEIRLEAEVAPYIWKIAHEIAKKKFNDNDAMMRSVLSNTIFSFNTNKRIFNSILLLSRLRQWQKMLRSLSVSTKWPLHDNAKEEYLGLAKNAAISILVDMEKSPYWHADPTGKRALNTAKKIRKIMTRRWFEGGLNDKQAADLIQELKPLFLEKITNPHHYGELLNKLTP